MPTTMTKLHLFLTILFLFSFSLFEPFFNLKKNYILAFEIEEGADIPMTKSAVGALWNQNAIHVRNDYLAKGH
jgi:hypothetical protein